MPALPLFLATAQATDSSGLLEPYLGSFLPFLYNDSFVWSVIGVAGVITFGGRFVIQWLYSEKEKKLVVPDIFWYLSFVGSTLNLTYAIHLDKFPLILGAIFLPPLYLRNIFLMRRKHSAETIPGAQEKES